MKTKDYTVNSNGDGMSDALEATEVVGTACGLSRKEVLRLRLLAEELFGMFRGITGGFEACYSVEERDKCFVLRLTGQPVLNQATRKKFLAVSSKRQDRTPKSFMEKLRNMITSKLFAEQEETSLFSLGMMSRSVSNDSSYYWTLQSYKEGVEDELAQNGAAKDAWDEMERSIVANIADDIRVNIRSASVEINIIKAFA